MGLIDYTKTILICGLHAVYMKTVFMLNALFFFHKMKDIQFKDFSLGIFSYLKE